MGLLAPSQPHNITRSKRKYFFVATFLALIASFFLSPASASAADSYEWANQDSITATVAPLGQQSDLFLYGPERGTIINFSRPAGPYTGDGERRYIGTVKRGNCEGKLILTVSQDSKGSGTIRTDPTTCLLGGSLGQLGKTITIGNVSAATKTDSDIRQECAALQLPYNEATGTCGGRADPGGNDNEEEETDSSQSDSDSLLCGNIDPSYRWLACPLTTLLTEIMQGIEELVHKFLTTDTSLFDNEGYQGAWEAFRTIALALIVIAGLIIVIGQAAGVQVLDAYTIKKALPRLIIATIFLTLSWPLLELVVTVNDTIARLLEGLIITPFNSVETAQDSGETIRTAMLNWLTAGGIVALLTAGAGAILPAVWGVLGSFLLVGAAGMIIAFIVIGIRAIIITVCIIAAPLAIACAILPATTKAFDIWRKAFISCLLVYPLIILLLTAGKIGALMSQDPLLSLLLFIVPYFAIPFAFSMIGGVMGKLAGIANNVNSGFFDRQRKKRQEAYGAMGSAARHGQIFDPSKVRGKNIMSRGLRRGLGGVNSTVRGAGLGMQGGFGVGIKGDQAKDQQMRMKGNDDMKAPNFQAVQNDTNTLLALHHRGRGLSKEETISTLENRHGLDRKDAEAAYGAAYATGLTGQSASIAAYQQLVYNGTDIRADKKRGLSAYEVAQELAGEASMGNAATAANLGGYTNATAKKVGRFDMSPGGGPATSDFAHYVQTGGAERYAPKAGQSQSDIRASRIDAMFDSTSTGGLVTGKPYQLGDLFTPHYEQQLREIVQSGDYEDPKNKERIERIMVVEKELQGSNYAANGDNREQIANFVQAIDDIKSNIPPDLLAQFEQSAATKARAYGSYQRGSAGGGADLAAQQTMEQLNQPPDPEG